MVFSKTSFTIHTIMKNVNDRLTTSILAAKVEIVLLDLRRQKKKKKKELIKIDIKTTNLSCEFSPQMNCHCPWNVAFWNMFS
jgi:glucan phosphorylase